MNANTKPLVLFVSLPYATKNLHIGRLGGSFIPASIYQKYYAKFEKRSGIIISGLDCYGTDIYLNALTKHLTPQQYILEVKEKFKLLLDHLGIDLNSIFLTTDLNHEIFVQNHIDELISKNRTTVVEKEKKYCLKCNIFLADRFLIDSNDVPHEKIIENNLEPKLPYKCKLCCSLPIEKPINILLLNYLPYLSEKYSSQCTLQNIIEKNKELSRSKNPWGLPNSPKVDVLLKQPSTCYVWIEALLSYIEQFRTLSKKIQEESQVYYFYAKDNRYYHQIILPQLIPEERISPHLIETTSFCRNYFLFSNKKMSSSLNNCINPLDILVPGDLLRYAIAKMDTLNSDSEINVQKVHKFCEDYLKEYVNLIKRIDGVTGSKRLLSQSTKKIDNKYHQYMKGSQLKKSLDLIHLHYQYVSKKIDDCIKQGNLLAESSTLYSEIYDLFDHLEPFTPKTSNLIKSIIKSNLKFRFNLDNYKIQVTG